MFVMAGCYINVNIILVIFSHLTFFQILWWQKRAQFLKHSVFRNAKWWAMSQITVMFIHVNYFVLYEQRRAGLPRMMRSKGGRKVLLIQWQPCFRCKVHCTERIYRNYHCFGLGAEWVFTLSFVCLEVNFFKTSMWQYLKRRNVAGKYCMCNYYVYACALCCPMSSVILLSIRKYL